jgi:hypothetical protein
MTARCRSCNASIIWTITTNGKRMPIDAEPVEDGNVMVDEFSNANYLSAEQRQIYIAKGGKLFKSHFATCQFAETHRRRSVVDAMRSLGSKSVTVIKGKEKS